MSVISLEEVAHVISAIGEDKSRMQFGGKAVNLGILLHKGFPVPRGFVLPTSDFETVLQAELRRHPTQSPQDILRGLRFSDRFVEEIAGAMQACGAKRWAVRSSSTDEDSTAHSFAGLQQSVIGVDTVDAVIEAIRTVWLSFYARERLLYPIQASLCAPVPSMAVVIQEYVDSQSAGVVFTRHPMEGMDSLLVNVSRGQGANVVDGREGESLTIEKRGMHDAVESECLTSSQIAQIVQTACAIESAYGKAQDIEFAFSSEGLFVLQTRDIADGVRNAEQTLYSNVNVGEALAGVCTPMTWSVGLSIAKVGFDTVFAMFGLAVPPNYDFVTTFHGHIYLNISQMMSMASQVPFLDPSLFGKLLGIQSIQDYAGAFTPLGRGHFLRHLPHSIGELLRLQARIMRLPRKARDFERDRDALLRIDLRHASCDEIREAFRRLHALFLECGIDMLAAGGACLVSFLVCSGFIEHFRDDADGQRPDSYLFSGLMDVQSAAPGLALLDMANEIRKWPRLMQAFLDEENFDSFEEFKAKIVDLPGYSAFSTRLSRFLSAYGARAYQEAELANPRWRESPGFLFRVIRTHLKAGTHAESQRITETASSHREEHTNEFKSMLSRSLRPIFRSILGWAHKYARLREVWRAYVVDVLGIFRKYFLDVAHQLVDIGILGRVEDIFFLTYEEFQSYLETPENLASARQRVAFRRARHEAFQSAPRLPDTFLTHPNECRETADGMHREVLYGLPASPGCVQARVRIAHTLEEAANLAFGEVLVTSFADVGWTPLFLVAGAILTERGGPLSHAFVVAREYGIPAVVSIPRLLDTLKTGDLVRVCGEKGTVVILPG